MGEVFLVRAILGHLQQTEAKSLKTGTRHSKKIKQHNNNNIKSSSA